MQEHKAGPSSPASFPLRVKTIRSHVDSTREQQNRCASDHNPSEAHVLPAQCHPIWNHRSLLQYPPPAQSETRTPGPEILQCAMPSQPSDNRANAITWICRSTDSWGQIAGSYPTAASDPNSENAILSGLPLGHPQSEFVCYHNYSQDQLAAYVGSPEMTQNALTSVRTALHFPQTLHWNQVR